MKKASSAAETTMVFLAAQPRCVNRVGPTISLVSAGIEITLTWLTSHADSVTISGLGKVDPSGKMKLTIDKTTEFTIEAIGPEGPVTQKVTVTVK